MTESSVDHLASMTAQKIMGDIERMSRDVVRNATPPPVSEIEAEILILTHLVFTYMQARHMETLEFESNDMGKLSAIARTLPAKALN